MVNNRKFRRGIQLIWMFALCGLQSAVSMTNINVVTDFGATPAGSADDAPALQNALQALKDAGGGEIFIPTGSYIFNSKVGITNDGTSYFTIRGEAGTQIYVNNTDGFIKIKFGAGTTPEATLCDMTIIALKEGAGTAVEITGGGLANQRVANILNINVRGQTTGPYYFNRGVVVTNCYRPLIADCKFSRTTSTDMSDTSSNFYPDVGFDISDCYAAVIQKCSVKGAQTAYLFDGTQARNPEDGAIRDSTADYCKVGVHFHEDGGREPTFWVTDCTIKARDIGVEVINRKICHITDNTFQQLSTSYALTDVKFENVHLGYVLGNTFSGALSGGRTNIVVDANGLDITIRENVWGPEGKSVQLPADAATRRIECQD